jgi:hypothetical protein
LRLYHLLLLLGSWFLQGSAIRCTLQCPEPAVVDVECAYVQTVPAACNVSVCDAFVRITENATSASGCLTSTVVLDAPAGSVCAHADVACRPPRWTTVCDALPPPTVVCDRVCDAEVPHCEMNENAASSDDDASPWAWATLAVSLVFIMLLGFALVGCWYYEIPVHVYRYTRDRRGTVARTAEYHRMALVPIAEEDAAT